MKHSICGIIAEFNPFHEGHDHLIREAGKLTGAEDIVCIMSPDFVQRGGPAIEDKYTRTRAALEAGCGCVLELPVQFATASAGTFASAGVTLLAKAGIDCLCFGSECGSIEALSVLADVLSEETAEFSDAVRSALRSGLSYPSAIEQALLETVPGGSGLASSYARPNDRLAVEYLRALKAFPGIEAFTVQRLPGVCASDVRARRFAEGGRGLRSSDFSSVLAEKLLTAGDLTIFEDVDADLASRIRKLSVTHTDFEELAAAVKTKAYTCTRVDRALTHILLGITSDQVRHASECGYASYLRVLGYRKDAKHLIGQLSAVFPGPVLLKLSDAETQLSVSDLALLEGNLFASDLWRAVRLLKYRDEALSRKPERSAGIMIV